MSLQNVKEETVKIQEIKFMMTFFLQLDLVRLVHRGILLDRARPEKKYFQ